MPAMPATFQPGIVLIDDGLLIRREDSVQILQRARDRFEPGASLLHEFSASRESVRRRGDILRRTLPCCARVHSLLSHLRLEGLPLGFLSPGDRELHLQIRKSLFNPLAVLTRSAALLRGDRQSRGHGKRCGQREDYFVDRIHFNLHISVRLVRADPGRFDAYDSTPNL
jgi:hypothetical protein